MCSSSQLHYGQHVSFHGRLRRRQQTTDEGWNSTWNLHNQDYGNLRFFAAFDDRHAHGAVSQHSCSKAGFSVDGTAMAAELIQDGFRKLVESSTLDVYEKQKSKSA
jgi:hypothetical protein